MRRICWSILRSILGSLLLASLPAGAQSFSETANVIAVEVPVQVLRDGEPVRGLTAADFEVWEGKRKLPVTGFEALDLNALPAGDEHWKSPQAIAARRHFLLLFDMGFSLPRGVEKAQTAARDLLGGLHPSDLVAVAVYFPSSGPQLLLGFTTDRAQVARALDALGRPEMFNRAADPLRLVLGNGASQGYSEDPRDLSEIMEDLRNAGSREERRGLMQEARAAARAGGEPAFLDGPGDHIERSERTAQQRAVTAMARAFEDLAKTVGGLYGRKYVVLFSEGFDSAVFAGTADVDEQLDMSFRTAKGASVWSIDSTKRFGDTKTGNDLEAMLEEFRRADCVIQAVDIGGLREGAGPTLQWAGGRDSLFLLADSTGGELFENYNDLSAAMEQMLRRTSVTYVLTVQPEGLQRDGSYHQIRVELKKEPRGARVVHRSGYYAPRPFGQQSPTERLLRNARGLMAEGPADGQAGTIATSVLAAAFPGGTAEAYVPVIIEVDGRSLKAGTEGWLVPLEIYAYAFDAQGQARDFFSQTVGLELLKVGAALEQSGLKFFGHLDLPPGSWAVRVLVRNAATGAAGVRSVTVQVPPTADAARAEPYLLPAFFPEPAGKWLTVREAQPGEASYPFLIGDQPYIPAALPALGPGEEARLSLVGYHLRDGDLRAEAKVLTADGRETGAGEIRLLQRRARGADGADRVDASFKAPRLAPGEYLLRITLTDPDGGAQSSVAPFLVKM